MGGSTGWGWRGCKATSPPLHSWVPLELWSQRGPPREGGGSQHPQAIPRHPHPPRGVPPALNWGCGRLPRGVGGDNTGLQSCCSAGTPPDLPWSGSASPHLHGRFTPPPPSSAHALWEVFNFLLLLLFTFPPTHTLSPPFFTKPDSVRAFNT